MLLEELIPDAGLEDYKTEYKRQLNRDDILSWLKTAAGFANADGGDLYVGVDDETHTLLGFDRHGADKERNYFNSQVNEHLVPRPDIRIEFLRYNIRNQERFILHIIVKSSAVKPVILKYKNVPAIYMRRDGFTNGATYEEIIEMSIKSQHAEFDTLPSDRLYQREDFTGLLSFFKEHNNGREYTDKALQSIGFFNEKGILANGSVLFADDYGGSKTDMTCSVFSGFNRGSERIVTVNRFHGNLIQGISYACDFVSQRMNHSIIKTDTGRINLDAYPARAVFEGVVNAVAHRDYFLDGTQIQIDMFRDRLEISSPGSFYRGAPFEKTYNLSSIISKRRNELICSVLVACNVMEAAGTGFDKIAEDYAGVDANHKPYIFSASDHFTLVLPDLTYDKGVLPSDSERLEFVPPHSGTKYDASILMYCFGQARKVTDIAEHLGLSPSSYFRKNILNHLIEQKYLLESKKGRSRYYQTNPNSVRLK